MKTIVKIKPYFHCRTCSYAYASTSLYRDQRLHFTDDEFCNLECLNDFTLTELTSMLLLFLLEVLLKILLQVIFEIIIL